MILPFRPQFVEPILKGIKIHTIREDRHRRWKPGRSIQSATGVRTKNYHCFFHTECRSVQSIFMTYAFNDVIEITIDGRYISSFSEKEALAKNDGFANYQEFFNWFYPIIEGHPDKHYSGRIIHWTDCRY